MPYRLVEIDVRRCGLGYSATAVLEDDGEGRRVPGFDLESGPWSAWTHRRAWLRALRANGGRLWPRVRGDV